MKLYIIGNGFDLNHDIKTSYNDYKVFLEKNYSEIFYEYEHFDYLSVLNDTRWADIESSLTIDYDALIDKALQYYPEYMDDSDSKWGMIKIDVESQTEFIKPFTGKCFYEWLCGFKVIEAKKKFQLDKADFYVNFNYTDTLEQIYNIPADHILHIHGQFSKIKNLCDDSVIRKEIQFGTPYLNSNDVYNELETKYEERDFFAVSIEPGIRDICEFIEKSSKNTHDNYEKLKSFLKQKEITEVIIMGHSLNSIDYAYYSDILLPANENKLWVFYIREKDTQTKREVEEFVLKNNLSNHKIKNW